MKEEKEEEYNEDKEKRRRRRRRNRNRMPRTAVVGMSLHTKAKRPAHTCKAKGLSYSIGASSPLIILE